MDRLYIIVRADLSPGAQCAQACHALSAFAETHRRQHKEWHDGEKNLVVLQVADEATLQSTIEQAAHCFVRFASFREPDFDNQITACAFEGSVAKLVSSLPLALREKRAA